MGFFGGQPQPKGPNIGGRLLLGGIGLLIAYSVLKSITAAIGAAFASAVAFVVANAVWVALGCAVLVAWRLYALRMGANPIAIGTLLSKLNPMSLFSRLGGGGGGGGATPKASAPTPLPPARALPGADKMLSVLATEPSNPSAKGAGAEEIRFRQAVTSLKGMTGLKTVKADMFSLAVSIRKKKEKNAARAKAGQKPNRIVIDNMLFLGNAGTGKTTVVEHLGVILKGIGALQKGHVVAPGRSELIGQFQGDSAVKTKAEFMKALGGIFFLDEAYALCTGPQDSYGIECLNTLVPLITQYAGQVLVIAAGYTADIDQKFLDRNQGLRSRFPKRVQFEDFTPDEMLHVAVSKFDRDGHALDDEAIEALQQALVLYRTSRVQDWGNARDIVTFVERVVSAQENRLGREEDGEAPAFSGSTDPSTIVLREDIIAGADSLGVSMTSGHDFELPDLGGYDEGPAAKAKKEDGAAYKEALAKLKALVGMRSVKSDIQSMASTVQVQLRRRAAGDPTAAIPLQNMIFTGNPGTGKTTVAELLGPILAGIGALTRGHVVVVKRDDLVGEVLGSSAPKTKAKFMEALGGILFIDEAYSLTENLARDQYAKEVIDTLVPLMTEYSGKVLVIAAGYTAAMKRFLTANEGLASRFPKEVLFPDYSIPELCEIFTRRMQGKFDLDAQTLDLSKRAITALRASKSGDAWGNSREIGILADNILIAQGDRIARTRTASPEAERALLRTLTPQDIEAGATRSGVELSAQSDSDSVLDALEEALADEGPTLAHVPGQTVPDAAAFEPPTAPPRPVRELPPPAVAPTVLEEPVLAEPSAPAAAAPIPAPKPRRSRTVAVEDDTFDAIAEGRTTLLFVRAQDCPGSLALDPVFESFAGAGAKNSSGRPVLFASAEAESSEELCERFDIHATPTVVLVSEDGARVESTGDAEGLVSLVRALERT